MEPKTLTYDDLVAMGVIGRTPVKAETFPLADAIGVPESQQPPIMRNSLPVDVASDIQRLNSPPQDEKTFFDRIPKWNAIIEKLRDPMVRGPLETFFTALSAPIAPWENTWSRLGRAAAMYSMHKTMLEENARRQPYEDKMKEIEMRAAEARAASEEEVAKQRRIDTEVAAATKDTRIKKLEQELRNAILRGDVEETQRKIDEYKLRLMQMFGEAEAKAKINNIIAETERLKAQTNLANTQAKQIATETKLAGGTDNSDRQNAIKSFYSTWDVLFKYPYLEAYARDPRNYGGRIGFIKFLNENDLVDVYNKMVERATKLGIPIKFGPVSVPSGHKPGEAVPRGYKAKPGEAYFIGKDGQMFFK